MTLKTASYHIYLLRIWQEQRDDKPIWRSSLEDAYSVERHGFVNLRDLFSFLAEQVGDRELIKEVASNQSTDGKASDSPSEEPKDE